MLSKKVMKKVISVSLFASIGFTSINLGQAPLIPSASAATIYETKVTSGVNFRTSPNTNGSKIRMLPKGEQIHVMDKVNEYWLKVKDKKGKVGYISSNTKYTNYKASTNQPDQSSATGDKVIALAKSYQGRVSYDYGTRNPSKLIFDCSSFTQFIYRQVGVELKWGTKQQKSQGVAVAKSNLKKGDLVFFDTIGSNNKVINHVGIYYGNGQFIHNSPSSDGISINSLNSGWWTSHYVSARRVL